MSERASPFCCDHRLGSRLEAGSAPLSLSLSRLVLKKIIPLSPSLSLKVSVEKNHPSEPLSLSLKVSVEKNHPSEPLSLLRLVLKKIIPLSMLSHGFEL